MNNQHCEKIWRQRPWNEEICRVLANKMRIPLEIAVILQQRGITEPEAIEAFLRPKLEHLPLPVLMKGMSQAVGMLAEAIREKWPVLIYGDYDVDGITGSAVLYLFLKSLGVDVDYYLPNRLTEGYGLHGEAITKYYQQAMESRIRQSGALVLITVDCGITDIEEVRVAKRLGFRVIITDHHVPGVMLPEADAILNPLQPDCLFPYKQMAGVGVAFYLVMGLRGHLHAHGFWTKDEILPNLKKYLDLVALGTIADVVPLTGVNRILTRAGLDILADNPRIGVSMLLEKTGLLNQPLSAEQIAFQVCPRINAAGRVLEPGIAMRLLTTDSATEAEHLATVLEAANSNRKNLGNLVYESAHILAADELGQKKISLVLGSSDWHPGVLGIVATRIMDQYRRPTMLFRFDEQQARGSGRAMQGINLIEILSSCKDYLIEFGGHAGAVGCSMHRENFQLFAEQFERESHKRIKPEALQAVLWIDLKVQPSALNSSLFLKYYQLLQPFGCGNEEPVFLSATAGRLVNPKQVGRGSLKFVWRENGFSCLGFGFGLAGRAPDLANNDALVAYKLRNNTFRGANRWEIKAEDIRIITTV